MALEYGFVPQPNGPPRILLRPGLTVEPIISPSDIQQYPINYKVEPQDSTWNDSLIKKEEPLEDGYDEVKTWDSTPWNGSLIKKEEPEEHGFDEVKSWDSTPWNGSLIKKEEPEEHGVDEVKPRGSTTWNCSLIKKEVSREHGDDEENYEKCASTEMGFAHLCEVSMQIFPDEEPPANHTSAMPKKVKPAMSGADCVKRKSLMDPVLNGYGSRLVVNKNVPFPFDAALQTKWAHFAFQPHFASMTSPYQGSLVPQFKEKKYSCKKCDKEFIKPSLLANHVKYVCVGKKLPCTKCSKEFGSAKYLNAHMKNCQDRPSLLSPPVKVNYKVEIMGGQRKFLCNRCGQFFAFVATLKDHQTLSCGGPKAQCFYCDKLYCSKSAIRYHIHNNHMNGKVLYTCQKCGKSYTCETSLYRHVKRACGRMKFPCQKCVKVLSSPYSLNRHEKRFH